MTRWWKNNAETVGWATVHLLTAASVPISEAIRAAILRRPWIALELLEELKPREAEILRLRFGIDDGQPRTLAEIGKRYRLTRERIRQIEADGLARLQVAENGGKGLDALYRPSRPAPAADFALRKRRSAKR
jgi:hypothetical protein